MVLPQRHAQLRVMPVDQRQREAAHGLEAGQPGAELALRQPEQLDRGLDRWHGGPGGQPGCRLRVQRAWPR